MEELNKWKNDFTTYGDSSPQGASACVFIYFALSLFGVLFLFLALAIYIHNCICFLWCILLQIYDTFGERFPVI